MKTETNLPTEPASQAAAPVFLRHCSRRRHGLAPAAILRIQILVFLVSVPLAVLGGEVKAPRPGPRPLAGVVRGFSTDEQALNRFYHLPWSEARWGRMRKFYRHWRDRLGRVDFATLNQQGRIDYLLLRDDIEWELERLQRNERRLKSIEPLVPFRKAIQSLQLARWRSEPINGEKSAEAVAAMVKEIKALRGRIKKKSERKAGKTSKAASGMTGDAEKEGNGKGPLYVDPVRAVRAAGAVSALSQTLREWYQFYDGFQPEFDWWMKEPYQAANQALADYAKFLRQDIAGLKGKPDDPLIGEPIGRPALIEDLKKQRIAYSPEQLIAIARQQFRWCQDQMKRAAKAMGFGDDWKAALKKVKSEHVPPGEQDRLVMQQAKEAIQFVTAHHLVTVPPLCKETWRVTMLSPEAQKMLPYAAYGGQRLMVAYANAAMSTQDKLMSMRGNNRDFIHIVAAHELIPGHHLQGFEAARHRAYRGLFRTPFFVEGWAVYWELRLWDLGYGRTPEQRMGMLFWRMVRCARIIVSLKFHLGQMSPEEMVAFMENRVGLESYTARSEVRRYIGGAYSPLYQCGYLLGALQLRALRNELVETGRMTDRQFNDAVLRYNAIPVDLIRDGLLSLPLTRHTEATWKFAGQ